jgi:hypothetical protein
MHNRMLVAQVGIGQIVWMPKTIRRPRKKEWNGIMTIPKSSLQVASNVRARGKMTGNYCFVSSYFIFENAFQLLGFSYPRGNRWKMFWRYCCVHNIIRNSYCASNQYLIQGDVDFNSSKRPSCDLTIFMKILQVTSALLVRYTPRAVTQFCSWYYPETWIGTIFITVGGLVNVIEHKRKRNC